MDLEAALGNPGSSTLMVATAAVESASRKGQWRFWLAALPWALAGAAMTFALFALRSSWTNGVRAARPILQTYNLNLYADAPLTTAAPAGSSIVVAPDCSKVVYVGRKEGAFIQLYWKRINDAEFTLVPDSHQFSIANNGTLIYARGHQLDPKYQLVWLRDRGDPEVVPLAAGDYHWPRLAPDGRTVLLNRRVQSAMKTVLVNLADGQAAELGGGSYAERYRAFALDETNIFINRVSAGELSVLRVRADGSGQPEPIYRVKQDDVGAFDISRDGRHLVLVSWHSGLADILLKDLRSADDARPFANTPANEVGPRFSPDGRWLAYPADMGERNEVYVRPVSEGGLPIQISKDGGRHPIWSRDASRLYYRTDQGIMMVRVKSRGPLELEAPTVFARGRFRSSGLNYGPSHDVFTDADGDRLLALKSIDDEPEPQGATQVTVLVHFDEYLRQQAGGERPSQREK